MTISSTSLYYCVKAKGLSTLILLENCYYHAQWSNQKSVVFLLKFRTIPSLTFVHKFPISLCPFLILSLFLPFSPFPFEKLGKLEIFQDNTPFFTTFSCLTPSFFYVEKVVRFHYRSPREIWIWLLLRCLKIWIYLNYLS